MPADLCKRIIPCLDVDESGRTVKGVRFTGLRDIGDPVALARRYQDEGADELLFLDISASQQGRGTLLDVVDAVARDLMIPFTVGGGISSLEQARALLQRGADKVTINTAAVRDPDLISAIAETFGSQCCVLAIDARRVGPKERGGRDDGEPRYEVLTHGGRTATGRCALRWAQEAVSRGAGEILLTSWDRDGTREGFDLTLTRALSLALPVPVIASGGAAGPESFLSVFQEGCADAALAASIFHDEQWSIAALKARLHEAGIQVRL